MGLQIKTSQEAILIHEPDLNFAAPATSFHGNLALSCVSLRVTELILDFYVILAFNRHYAADFN